ncbi:hypothetical protein BJY04DRAFT_220357 [Aspergillus karnatakaensis]|uniref:uncharacterized protein n=1 Tax=Aspergillus karnatakaensis TaxID=1810916 RepID=UPI003CCD547D
MDRLPLEIFQLICALIQDHDANDLYALRLVNHQWLQVSTPLLFESLNIILRNGDYVLETLPGLNEFDKSGLGRQYLEHARKLNIITVRDVDSFGKVNHNLYKYLKEMQANLFSHIPPVAASSFLEHFCLAGIHPGSTHQPWQWVFDAYWKSDWQPLVTLISRLQRLTHLNYGLPNRFPKEMSDAIATYHPNCFLNIWSGVTPLIEPRPAMRTFFHSNPVLDPLSRPDDHSLSHLHAYIAMCPEVSNKATPRQFTHMTEHLLQLAACRSLKHLEVRLDGRWGDYDQVNQAKEKWTRFNASMMPSQAIKCTLHSLHVTGNATQEDVLLSLANVFDFSGIQSLDLQIWANPALLQDMAPRFSNLQRLFIRLDTKLNKDPNLLADHEGVIDAVMAFKPLQYLCLCGVRSSASLHLILSHHGPTLRGLSLAPTRAGRSGPGADWHYKYPDLMPADIMRMSESAPNIRELRIPLKRTKGNSVECAKYRALGSFANLRCLLLDLHYDHRSPPADPNWHPSDAELREVLVNAAMDEALARSIWTIIASNQASKYLRNLTCRPFGSESLEMPEAFLVMSLGRTYLIKRPVFDAFEPLEIKRVADGGHELAVEHRFVHAWGGRGLTKHIKAVFDEVWPGKGKWQTRWRSFPLQGVEE